jgi:hypothetical protein
MVAREEPGRGAFAAEAAAEEQRRLGDQRRVRHEQREREHRRTRRREPREERPRIAEQRGARKTQPLQEQRNSRKLVQERGRRPRKAQGHGQQLGDQHDGEHRSRRAEIGDEEVLQASRGVLAARAGGGRSPVRLVSRRLRRRSG